jgi:hypothetical protein
VGKPAACGRGCTESGSVDFEVDIFIFSLLKQGFECLFRSGMVPAKRFQGNPLSLFKEKPVSQIQIIPVAGRIGAEIRGVKLSA